MMYGEIGLDQMLPVSLMGDGLGRVLGILVRMANTPGGIVLIDEIENGLHYSLLSDFWRAIGDAAERFNCQVIATTHSYECIREAHSAFSQSDGYDFLLHRLDRIDSGIEATTYDKAALSAAIKAEFEVR
jgi:AAA15 family ATPase/GTPase